MSAEDARFEALETQLAFQESTLNELSDVIVAQQAHIERLEATLTELIERLRAEPALQELVDPQQERPPHY